MNTCWKCAEPCEVDDRFCGSCGSDQSERPARDDAPVAVATVARVAPPAQATAEPELGGASAASLEPAPEPPPAPEPTQPPSPDAAAEPEPEPEPEPERAPARTADDETGPLAGRGQLVIDPVELVAAPTRGSVHDAIGVRRQLWADVDAAATLLATIESTAKPATGTVAGTVESHPRITSDPDLLVELRAVEIEIRNEVQAIGERETQITSHEAEIARLNRNKMILMLVIGAVVLLVIILIASAL